MSYDEIGIPARNGPPSNESFTLKAKTSIYEVSLPQLQKLFAKELGVPEERITLTVNFRNDIDGIDERFDRKVFDGLTVTVKG